MINEDDWDSDEVRFVEFNDEIFIDIWEIKVVVLFLLVLGLFE